MNATPDSTLADPQQIIADLQRQLAERRAERDEALAKRDEAQRRLAERTAERDEALEQQTATAEVLQVINSSPGDLAPVFDAMLEKATRLCEADFAIMNTYDGEHLSAAALYRVPPAYAELVTALRRPSPSGAAMRILRGEDVVHIDDTTESVGYRSGEVLPKALVELAGARSDIAVALRKDGKLLGTITVFRQEVRPFTGKQIALLQNFAAQAVIAMENARLLTETREALEQRTATADVLQVINRSLGDLGPVFDAMLDKAIRLCEATLGHMFTYDGERFHPAAIRGEPRYVEWQSQFGPVRPSPSVPLGRISRGERIVHIADVREEDVYRTIPSFQQQADIRDVRSQITVALLKDDVLLGAMVVYRQEVRPFSDKQIALLQNFASQAVIAMENARLITETREALEQQTATAEVLQVINSSPGDLTPVFDAMLEKALRLCEAAHGHIWKIEGQYAHAVALRGDPRFIEAMRQDGPAELVSERPLGRLARGEHVVHMPDATKEEVYRTNPAFREFINRSEIRTGVVVALRKDEALLGAIVVHRKEVLPFTDKQIALLQNFAAQAVIAMENARLITETREALEQQTATAEVLQVINSSPGDLAPVFEAILEKAHRLCGAAFGSLGIFEGETWRGVVQRGYGEPLAERLRQPTRGSDNPLLQQLLDGARLVHIADLAQLDHPIGHANVAAGIRTLLVVPLRKADALLGTISAARREVRPFSEKEIALLENFAAQAVIAMENARLLTETRQALEQQTATAEVLQVINSSPGDLAPVFQSIVEKAHTLCGAVCGSLQLWDGEKFRGVAMRGFSEAMVERLQLGYSPSDMPCQRIVEGERVVHCVDLAEIDSPVAREGGVKLGFVRTILYVALRKDDVLLGQIVAGRQEVRPFSEKEIALVENFAAQAVIAMDNARLLTETREALEQQTATAEVLGVINSSPGDLGPVFDAMLERATRLCEAPRGQLATFDGEFFRFVAVHGEPGFTEGQFAQGATRPEIGVTWPRIVRGERFVHIVDVMDSELYRAGHEGARRFVDVGGGRSLLTVALRKDEVLLGALTIYLQEVRPFSDTQIALLQNFAAQAVIAMENARLLTETREALEQQTATAEVLQVINSSPGDLTPVFDAILEKAHSLGGAARGTLFLFDGEVFRAAASQGYPGGPPERMRRGIALSEDPRLAALVGGERLIHIPDLSQLDDPIARAVAERGGVRTNLLLPLRKDGELLGVLSCNRPEVRPFSDKQIALLQNFAAQAVIAMENARLLTETREALDQQTATAEVLQVINSSPGDLAPVFDAILEKAHSLCGAATGSLHIADGDRFRAVAVRSFSGPFADLLRQPMRMGPNHPVWRAIAGERFVQISDASEIDDQRLRDGALGGFRTVLLVPLRKEEAFLGYIIASRREVRPFTDKQIALLQNFAAQAVIAMENARLITETREALEQQTATAEVLQVINSSPGDLAPVFDAMVEKAIDLCSAAYGYMYTYDGELIHPAAMRGDPRFISWWREQGARVPDRGSPVERALQGEPVVHIADARQEEAHGTSPVYKELVDLGGIRTGVIVALRKDNTSLGSIHVFRREVRPFSEKQLALLETFAAQAVIAMENARLLTETREALEQQTATAEVLQVINSSPGDLAPVFDAMLDKALRLCGAAYGALRMWDGEHLTRVAWRAPQGFEDVSPKAVTAAPGSLADRFVRGETVISISDLVDDANYQQSVGAQSLVRRGNARTFLGVALRKDDRLLGTLVIYRQEVRPFTEKQIALLQNFAAQAVIAIENARLLNELRDRTHDLQESLEYQTATSDVLKVISRSTFDLQPVLQTVLDTAVRLCRAGPSEIFRMERDGYRFAVGQGVTPEYEALERTVVIHPDPGTLVGRTVLERRTVHVLDAWNDPLYSQKDEARIGNFHTMLGVPLMREGDVVGVIALSRRVVEPFSEREIQLVTTFADQAVIAIENTRLITETREALEQQQAIAEILQVINRSPGDLQPVFDAILDKAHSLCGVDTGSLQLYDGENFRAVAIHGRLSAFAEELRQPRRLVSHHFQKLLAGEPVAQVLDFAQAAPRSLVARAGVRTVLYVALRQEKTLLGFIGAGRSEVRPFTDKESALLQNFAAQAVIAMDNARLLNEIRQRQAELRVTFDNMGDGVAMFDSDLRLAAWNLNFQRILDLPDTLLAERLPYADYIRFLARRGEFGSGDIEAELSRRLEGLGQELRFEHTRPDGRVIEVRRNAVPGGGFVVIYSDVTERKRAEAEIRAARDTAEKALQELQAAQASLLHAQKMAALGQLTAGIAHEIKNPLNFVNNFAELSGELLLELKETTAPAVAALGDDERAAVDEVVEMLRGNLDKIAEHGKRADGIVKSMLEHSRGVSGERRVVDLNALIEEALNLAYHGARAQDASFNIILEREFDRGLAPAELAPQEMTRVFLNLFGNGFYATAKRQRDGAAPDFRPTLKVATRDLGDAVEVRVRDNGTGIAPEIREKLFQPFVTTKPTGEGTGLGLSISYDIVTQQHGGVIEVDSRVGEFTEFTVRLPLSRRQAITAGGTV